MQNSLTQSDINEEQTATCFLCNASNCPNLKKATLKFLVALGIQHTKDNGSPINANYFIGATFFALGRSSINAPYCEECYAKFEKNDQEAFSYDIKRLKNRVVLQYK